MFFSYENLMKYVSSESRKYDLLFYLFFITETSVLPSVPSGFHSSNAEGWIGFTISLVFYFLFYPIFYYYFYRKKEINFIREIIIFSVVARLHSFLYVGCIAVGQMVLWSFFRLQKMPHASLSYYILYYVLFTLLMIFLKRRSRFL